MTVPLRDDKAIQYMFTSELGRPAVPVPPAMLMPQLLAEAAVRCHLPGG